MMNNNKYFEQNVVFCFGKLNSPIIELGLITSASLMNALAWPLKKKKPKRINLDKMPENSTNTSS